MAGALEREHVGHTRFIRPTRSWTRWPGLDIGARTSVHEAHHWSSRVTHIKCAASDVSIGQRYARRGCTPGTRDSAIHLAGRERSWRCTRTRTRRPSPWAERWRATAPRGYARSSSRAPRVTWARFATHHW